MIPIERMISIIESNASHFHVMGGDVAQVHEKAIKRAKKMLNGEDPVGLKKLKDLDKLIPKPIF